MAEQPQQAGLIDRVFNSSIALPQQLLWRLIRAAKEDDIKLWSEEGILDAALLPIAGWADDHKEDVMPDYMAKAFGLEPGLVNELAVSIFTDPLAYASGGLTAAGKAAKGANMAARNKYFQKFLATAARAGGRHGMPLPAAARAAKGPAAQKAARQFTNAEDLASQLSVQDMRDFTSQALARLAGRSDSESNVFAAGLRKAQGLMGNLADEDAAMSVLDLMKHEGKRKIAVGIPGLTAMGMRIDMPGDHESWWQAYKWAKERGGTHLSKAWLTRSLVGIPGVSRALREVRAPLRQFTGGYSVGAEARTAIKKPHRQRLGFIGPTQVGTPEQHAKMAHWLDARGGGKLGVQVTQKGQTKILEKFDEAIDGGLTPEEAFVTAFAGIHIKGEEPIQLWARLTGETLENAGSLTMPVTPQTMRKQMSKAMSTAIEDSGEARRLARSGEFDISPAALATGERAKALASERKELWKITKPFADTMHEGGRRLRTVVNRIFKTGTDTAHAQEAIQKFLANAGRSHDQVAELAKLLYAGVKKILSEPEMKGFDEESFSGLLGSIMEIEILHAETSASARLAKINPTNALDQALGWDNTQQRLVSILKTIEGVLANKGIKGDIADSLQDALGEDVFDYLPRIDKHRLAFHKTRRLEVLRGETKVNWTPQQKFRMRRRYNKHVIRSGGHAERYVGELTDGELDAAIGVIQSRAMRKMTPKEIHEHIDGNAALSAFRATHGLSHDELIGVLRTRSQGKRRRVKRWTERPEIYPLWNAGQKTWRLREARLQAEMFGLRLDVGPKGGGYVTGPVSVKSGKGSRERWGIEDKAYATLGEAMSDMRTWLETDRGKKWRKKYGPDVPEGRELQERIDHFVPGEDINAVRSQVGKDELALLRGERDIFDERRLLSESRPVRPSDSGDALDWYRMQQAQKARRFSREANGGEGLKEPNIYGKGGDTLYETVNTPEMTQETLGLTAPRIAKGAEFEDDLGPFLKLIKEGGGVVFDGVRGKELFESWGYDLARNGSNIRELRTWLRLQRMAGVENPKVPYELLAEISDTTASTHRHVVDLILEQMPESVSKLFDSVRYIQHNIFREALRTGTWVPGSPIGYVGRFFNHENKAILRSVLGSMSGDEAGMEILQRLTEKHPSRFARHYDNMSIEDVNALWQSVREASRAGNANATEWYDSVTKVLKEEGYDIRGLPGQKVKLTEDRLVADPIMSVLVRLAHANQSHSVEEFFGEFLKAGDKAPGQSLAIAGKVIAIHDDFGDPIEVTYPGVRHVERVSQKGKPERTAGGQFTGRTVHGEASTEAVQRKHKVGEGRWIILESDDGDIHRIPVDLGVDEAFGFLKLGRQADAEALDYVPTAAKAFVRASLRSELDNSFMSPLAMRGEQGRNLLPEMIGQHVLYGAENVIVGAAHGAAEALKVTPAAWRSADTINYMIKKWQTIYRVPFQVFNLTSGVFQASMAGVSPNSLVSLYMDAYRLLWHGDDFAKSNDLVSAMLDLPGPTSMGRGIIPRLEVISAAKRASGILLDDVDDFEMYSSGLSRTERTAFDLGHGQVLYSDDFARAAGNLQLYSSYAASLTRGSRTAPESLIALKLQTLNPTTLRERGAAKLADAMEAVGARPGDIREASEAVNRTATVMGLMREGHTLERAIEITKNAHVPYERLTPFERTYLKRAFLYYSFPRHYMPWAWSKFMDDPTKLAKLNNTIRSQRIISTDEGRVHLKLGDYRIDVGRANANLEATMMVGAFADTFAMPLGHALGAGESAMHPYDPNILSNQITDAGLMSFGGVFSMLTGGARLFPQGERSGMRKSNIWDEARSLIWPVKYAFQTMNQLGLDAGRGSPTKEGQSPYVDYTPMESLITNSDFGLGVRKVRPDHEVRNAYYEYRAIARKLRLRAAATEDPKKRSALEENIKMLSETLLAMRDRHELQEFD